MAQGYDNLTEGLDRMGEFVHELFQSEYGVYFLVLFVFTILFRSLIAAALSKIPLFTGEGDSAVNTSGNIIAWCISLLGVIAIGYQMKDNGADTVVNSLAGPWGSFLIIGLGIFASVGVYKATENFSEDWRWILTIATAWFIITWIYSYALVQGGKGSALLFTRGLSIIIFSFVAAFIVKKFFHVGEA